MVSPPGERLGAADGQPADLLCRRQVSLQQGRREIADRHVVETVARLIARQQRGDVDVEREQVANRILVFGAIEAAERIGTTRVGVVCGNCVESRGERVHRRLVAGFIGPWQPHRRHGAAA